MRQDLEEQLYATGPILYANKDLPMQETCMCWGFECPDTWFNELMKLTKSIEDINNFLIKNNSIFLIRADQVKEKFGGLRFYFSVVSDKTEFTPEESEEYKGIFTKAQRLIEDTETNLEFICSYCGCSENVDYKSINGWITVVCESCYNKQINKDTWK